MLGGAATLALALSGCSFQDIPAQLSIPDPATTQGEITYHQWQAFWVAAWAVGFVTLVLILGSAFWYRRRKGDAVPAQTRYNLPIEIMYTVTPLIMIGTLFYFTARDESRITAVTDNQDLTVNVVGYQWNWGFNYLDQGVYETGTPQQRATLYLPVDQKARFVLTSPDVIHSFWVPDFLFKMDVIPGRANQFELTPDKEGSYAGRCAELCGTYHSQMLFTVKVVSQSEFDAHMQQLRDLGQTGLLDVGRANGDAQQQGNTRFGPGGQNDLTNPLGAQQ
jgi:cytochrome c oxidase subunit 2